MPQWRGSTRKARLPRGWTQLRKRILQRDQYRCQHVREDTGRKCGDRATDVDHIIPNDDDSESNLQSLCAHHHAAKSSSEGGRAAAARKRAIKRRHPGILP